MKASNGEYVSGSSLALLGAAERSTITPIENRDVCAKVRAALVADDVDALAACSLPTGASLPINPNIQAGGIILSVPVLGAAIEFEAVQCVQWLVQHGYHAHKLNDDEVVRYITSCKCPDDVADCSCEFIETQDDEESDFFSAPVLMAVRQVLWPENLARSDEDKALAVLDAVLASDEACSNLNFWQGHLKLPTALMPESFVDRTYLGAAIVGEHVEMAQFLLDDCGVPLTSRMLNFAVERAAAENSVFRRCLADRATIVELSAAADACAAVLTDEMLESEFEIEEISHGIAAADAIGRRRVRQRAAEIAMALAARDLPVLVLVEIVSSDLFGVRKEFMLDARRLWSILERVKHFQR